jgi:arabinogalactan oligomer/maltooligosaccharide transport system substrate-binding protein
MKQVPGEALAARGSLLLLFLTAGILFFSGAGCGTTTGPKTSAASSKLVFWNTMGQTEAEALEPLIDEFQNQNPTIRVVMERIPFAQARSKFEQGVKAGLAPDILRTDRFWLGDFGRSGLLEPFDPAEVKEEFDDLLPAAREAVTTGDKIWGIPQSIDCLGLFYNKAHFLDARVAPPEDFDAFRATAKTLTDPGKGRYGFFLNPDGWWFEPFLFGFGGRYFDDQGVFALRSDQALKAIQFLLELKDTEKAMPPVNLRSNSYDLMMQSFKSGQVSMIINGPWAIRYALTGPAFKDNTSNLGIAPLPRGPAGFHTPMGCQTLAITKDSKFRAEALLFVKFLCSAKVESVLSKKNYGIPARKSLFSDPELKNDPFLQTFIQQLQTLHPTKTTPEHSQIYGTISDHLTKILNGDIAPKDALKDIESEWLAKRAK